MSDTRIGILFVLDSFPAPKAGTETQVWLLAQGLDRAVYKVGFLLLGESEFLAREMPGAARYVVGTRRMRSLAFWRGAWRAMRAARRDGFRIAHTWFNDSAIALPLPLKAAGFRVIGSRRDLGFWYTTANLRLLRLNTRFVDRVVCNSEAVREVVMREEGACCANCPASIAWPANTFCVAEEASGTGLPSANSRACLTISLTS
jgi:hypothetical protein